MKEDEYERVTYGITMAAAETFSRLNPDMTFIYVSGAGTDSSEQGRIHWARVKGKTENALLRFRSRPSICLSGVIQPLHGIHPKTKTYRVFYALSKPLLPLLQWIFPNSILTTEQIGRAMLVAVKYGAPMRVLESRNISALAREKAD